MKENSIKNERSYIEEAVKTMEHWVEYEKNNKDKINKAEELIYIQETILQDYKRVLKENEILKEEKEQAWEEWNNLEQGSYETEQKLKQQIKELQKENEELNKENEELHREINQRIKLKIENEKIVDTQFIYKPKIKDKIEELDIEISTCEYADDDSEEYKQEVEKDKTELLIAKKVLQQLLEESGSE